MLIREFSEQDIDTITSLMKELCLLKNQEFNEERWRTSLEKKRGLVVVAFSKDKNDVIGMGHCSVKISDQGFRIGVVSNLIVKEEERRSGIGEQLMKHMVDYFKKNHIQSIRLALKTKMDVAAAGTLFVKLGFELLFKVYELKI